MCCSKIEKISCTFHVRNEAVLHEVKEERNILHTIDRLTRLVTSYIEIDF
jgi:hypothetical protein